MYKLKLDYFCLAVHAELKRRRQRAQDNSDIPEEAKICNAIGELYTQSGKHKCVQQECFSGVRVAQLPGLPVFINILF